MKKIILALTVLLTGSAAFGQAATMGSIIVDPYFGGPNFGKSFTSQLSSTSTSNMVVRGFGPLGLRAEYVVSDKIGLGVDVIYNNYNATYNNVDSLYDGNTGTWTTQVTQDQYQMQRLRIQARMNFHFEVNNPNLDAYLGIGAGTNNRFRKYYVDNVLQSDASTVGDFTLIPFSLRICTGMRYYFTENVGLNLELGLGGPVFSGGLSFKF
jgi:hypothetical protein